MKKLMLYILITFLLTGCASVSDNTKTKDTEAGQEKNTQDSALHIPETEEILTESESIRNENSNIDALTYTSAGITVTVPASWQEKILVQESADGLSFFQKSSYEKEEGLGFLYGFYKTDCMIDTSAGAMPIAYTDTTLYYLQEPTDVTFFYEDDAIANEYQTMMNDKEDLLYTFAADAEDVHYDAGEFLLPLSYIQPIQEEVLVNMTADELWIARNEIYARHGRKFSNSYLDAYFAACSWYTPSVSADAFDESVLSVIEKKNVEVIQTQETIKKAERPYPQKMSYDKEYQLDLDGDGTAETFSLTYRTQEDDTDSVFLTVKGDNTYDLSAEISYLFNLNTDAYYITDISPHFAGLEIAVLDNGPSDDYQTHFFTWENGISYIGGGVEGFPFKEEMQLDGFAADGCVKSTLRTDLIHTCFSYANWYYDYEARKLVLQESEMYTMVPDGGHTLAQEIEIFIKKDTDALRIPLKAQTVFFLETDAEEWIKLKGKDGTEGYIHITDGQIDGTGKNAQEVITDLYFAG